MTPSQLSRTSSSVLPALNSLMGHCHCPLFLRVQTDLNSYLLTVTLRIMPGILILMSYQMNSALQLYSMPLYGGILIWTEDIRDSVSKMQ